MSTRQDAERLLPRVSRETWERLEALVALLEKWQRTINLVAPATLNETWTRHVADSLQLVSLAPDARTWVDLGSGAGFPGLVVAASLPEAEVHLVESDQRKAAFLREGARAMGVKVKVHADRAEKVLGAWSGPVDVVSARALAPLEKLLFLAEPLLKAGTAGLFLKGRDAAEELTQASAKWNITARMVPSVTESRSSVIVVSAAHPREGASV